MPEGDGDPPGPLERKRKSAKDNAAIGEKSAVHEAFYKPYTKQDYKRVFPDGAINGEFTVYVESVNSGENLGNRNPLVMASLFKNEVKGVGNIKRINAKKVGIIFTQAINANNFIKNEEWLQKNNFKAYIPAGAVETIGVLRFVPTSISNEELFKKLSSDYEIVSVRRFTKKENGEIKPFGSVSVTFLSRGLPDCVYLDIYRFRVHEYIAPLLQCFKCFKFNHAAKVCSSTQKCSICSEEHHYSTCSKDATVKCINCGGPHLAISRDCSVKKRKMEEKRNRVSYASALASKRETIVNNYNKDFPDLPKKDQPRPKSLAATKQKPAELKQVSNDLTNNIVSEQTNDKKEHNIIDEIVKSDTLINHLVTCLITLGNTNMEVHHKSIRELLLKTLKHG